MDQEARPAAIARASRPIRALAVLMAAWCLGFAAVNIVFQVTGRFAVGPYADLAAGLAVMDGIVVGLKLLGAVVAIGAVLVRSPTAVGTVLIWGAFGLLGLYSAGNVAELIVLVVSDPARIDLRSLAYVAFFLVGAVGYGVLAVSSSRRLHAEKRHALLGLVGAPLVLAALLVVAPAFLTAMGLFPRT